MKISKLIKYWILRIWFVKVWFKVIWFLHGIIPKLLVNFLKVFSSPDDFFNLLIASMNYSQFFLEFSRMDDSCWTCRCQPSGPLVCFHTVSRWSCSCHSPLGPGLLWPARPRKKTLNFSYSSIFAAFLIYYFPLSAFRVVFSIYSTCLPYLKNTCGLTCGYSHSTFSHYQRIPTDYFLDYCKSNATVITR